LAVSEDCDDGRRIAPAEYNSAIPGSQSGIVWQLLRYRVDAENCLLMEGGLPRAELELGGPRGLPLMKADCPWAELELGGPGGLPLMKADCPWAELELGGPRGGLPLMKADCLWAEPELGGPRGMPLMKADCPWAELELGGPGRLPLMVGGLPLG
jgi:PIN domain nuclease of toxin-antitoxin system